MSRRTYKLILYFACTIACGIYGGIALYLTGDNDAILSASIVWGVLMIFITLDIF